MNQQRRLLRSIGGHGVNEDGSLEPVWSSEDIIMSRAKYFFSNAEELLSYLEAKLDNPTPLKIQKSLYFLWAFYAVTYGSIDYSHKSEFSQIDKYPLQLFPASFEAWPDGPVLNKIYAEDKDNSITPSLEKKHCTTKMEKDVWAFIDDMIMQINPINDFGLVARSHQDKAWQDAYHAGKNHCKMNEEDIIRDYQKYVRESN